MSASAATHGPPGLPAFCPASLDSLLRGSPHPATLLSNPSSISVHLRPLCPGTCHPTSSGAPVLASQDWAPPHPSFAPRCPHFAVWHVKPSQGSAVGAPGHAQSCARARVETGAPRLGDHSHAPHRCGCTRAGAFLHSCRPATGTPSRLGKWVPPRHTQFPVPHVGVPARLQGPSPCGGPC